MISGSAARRSSAADHVVDLFGHRVHRGDDRLGGHRRLDALGQLELSGRQRVVHRQVADVGLDALGDLRRQTLDFDLSEELFEDVGRPP